jgi:Fe-S-cluster containining protein
MRIETDINKIEQLSQQRNDANWAFRSFLKGSALSVTKVDSIVHDLYKEISSQIVCTQCANCCKVIHPSLSTTDIKRLAHQFELTTKEFRSRFLKKNDKGEGFIFNGQPCPFLKNDRCQVYEQRPRDCRSYPHLHKHEFIFRMYQVVSNCPVCPIVFNVYEGLKQTLWPNRLK